MKLSDHLKMATSAILSHKLRSGLTMLGIIIGNASVIGMVAVGEGARKATAEQFEALGPNVLFVSLSSARVRRTLSSEAKPLLLEDAEAIGELIPNLTNIAPEIHINQLITYQDEILDTSITGTTPDYLPVRNFKIEKGRFINNIDVQRNKRVVVLGAEIVEKLFNNKNPIGKQIRIKNTTFEVIGTLAKKGALFDSNQDNKVIVPITTAQHQLRGWNSPYGIVLNTIALLAKDQNSVDAVKFQVKNLMLLRHGTSRENDVKIFSQNSLLNMAEETNAGLKQMLGAIAFISLLVGGIGVMNIMLVSVKERTGEIGLRKALGATPKDILGQFILEAILLATFGSLLGIKVGLGGVFIAHLFFSIAASISIPSIIIAVSVSGSVGLFFGVFPAQQAAKLDPIIALKSY
ncbi:putative ABC transporter permease protein [Crocosphaera subtropica ATCC 51142]|uniref:ABC transporter permease protein n=1 Tax=Crocosphaera subtropica (strain ATCC 51142 / BH68) TaxID=43989 RepID=B1WWW9_CROS5|nr:ABC transporter permease [Crocosphaera subtropica]ACB52438.1 putative ABC transporter permease protein [Crocosphaera subtropica ATCC 51142]